MLSVAIRSFQYSEKVILRNIAFKLERGRHLALLGESGCGKSTLLHLIYGLLHLENGTISWNNKKLLGPNYNLIPGESCMKLVAQEFNVMPFSTVSENIASHLTSFNSKKDDRRILELLQVVDLMEFANTLVKNLSGGQKQRVALAKALANKPELLLLDEPFSNIDTFRKNKLRRDLFEYLKENNISCITATHDSEEALSYSDELLMLKDGAIEVFGRPEEVFKNLKNIYQAGFFGEVNQLPSQLFKEEIHSEEVVLLPHQLVVSEEKSKCQVTVKKSYFRGSHYLIQSSWNDKDVFFEHPEGLKKSELIYLKRK
jgi:iron(III) transport system ATP-binding protein